MIIRNRFLLLIHILCCAAAIHGILLDVNDVETCNLLCMQCNASAVFENGLCECNFAGDSDKASGAECIHRIQKEIQAIELNMLSEDLTDEERNVRSILKYRRRLRPGDAEKVAQYFIDGGPAAGHSHFVRMFNATRDNVDSVTNSFSGVVDESNPEDGFHGVPLTSSVSWNTCGSPLYVVPEYAPYASPTMQDAEMYPPTLRAANPPITYPTSGVYGPTVPLGAPVHHGLPHALFRAATFPAHVLHHILHPHVHHQYHHPVHHRGIVRSSNFPQDIPDTPVVGQSCENNDGSSLAIAGSNPDKSAEQSVPGLIDPSQYPETYITHSYYQPMQYQAFPYPYTSYYPYSPLTNMLHPITNRYVLQPASSYARSMSDPVTSASNPHSFCKNEANTEQRNGAVTADRTVYSNDGIEKSDDLTRNNIPKDEKKPERNGSDKS